MKTDMSLCHASSNLLRRWGVAVVCTMPFYAHPPAFAEDDYSVAWGTVASNEFIDTHPACPEGRVCMNGWFRFVIHIERVIAGFPLEGEIRAARMQHAEYVLDEDNRAVFVLAPIETDEEKALVGADYYLREWSRAQAWHCFSRPIENYIDDPAITSFQIDRRTSCVPQEALFQDGADE